MRRYLVVLLSLIGSSVVTAIPASAGTAAAGGGGVDHLITCYLTASRPVKQAPNVTATAVWSCAPSKPDIVEVCIWIELNFFGTWERNSPSVCDGGKQSGSVRAVGGCDPGTFQYRAVAVINAFHGEWDRDSVRTTPVAITC